jgi:hypothetical protein
MSQYVTISRQWDNPQIKITLDDEEISIKMKLSDFLTAIKQEIGRVTWTFTTEAFSHQFDLSVDKVLLAMKQETKKVVR